MKEKYFINKSENKEFLLVRQWANHRNNYYMSLKLKCLDGIAISKSLQTFLNLWKITDENYLELVGPQLFFTQFSIRILQITFSGTGFLHFSYLTSERDSFLQKITKQIAFDNSTTELGCNDTWPHTCRYICCFWRYIKKDTEDDTERELGPLIPLSAPIAVTLPSHEWTLT